MKKAERVVNSRRFLARGWVRASFCDAIIKNRERERERGVFCEDEEKKGKEKKNVSGPILVQGPKKASTTRVKS